MGFSKWTNLSSFLPQVAVVNIKKTKRTERSNILRKTKRAKHSNIHKLVKWLLCINSNYQNTLMPIMIWYPLSASHLSYLVQFFKQW